LSPSLVTSLVTPFLLTLGVSFLIGIGLREYYEGERKYDTFGTVRTFVFIGMLGFVLFQLPEVGHTAYLMGMAALGLFLLVYYGNKVLQKKSPGMIGVLIALLTYATGPIALHMPQWYLVLLAVSILFVLHSKGRIRQFTDRLETGEVVTACKFLAIVAVILPLIPAMPEAGGAVGRFLAESPVTLRQAWLAVVITTGISYLGYVLQTYLFPRKGLLLAGVVGGVYSSTVTVLVLAKKSMRSPEVAGQAAAGIMLAVSMMYLRLLALVAIFRFQSAVILAPLLLGLAGAAAAYGLWRRRQSPDTEPPQPVPGRDVGVEPELRRNPLELNSALLFAVLFAVVAFATKYVLVYFKDTGLRLLSFVVGFSDITPFVVSLLQGNYGIGDAPIVQAVVIASASNNLLKLAYAYIFGIRRTAWLVTPGMLGLVVLSVAYVVFGL
jgi:uncharacterized membrane protein (DUF4010 family)